MTPDPKSHRPRKEGRMSAQVDRIEWWVNRVIGKPLAWFLYVSWLIVACLIIGIWRSLEWLAHRHSPPPNRA